MRAIFLALLAAVLSGCPNAVGNHGGTGGFDTGVPGPHGPACAGQYCRVGEECCLSSGLCFAPGDRAVVCPPLSTGGGIGAACASNLDCRASEFCSGQFCLGEGTCQARDGCNGGGISCFGRGCPPPLAACGCDGRTYATLADRCQAGVRGSLGFGACGTTPMPPEQGGPDASVGRPLYIGCGGSSQCPEGQSCCALYGICVPSDCPECCSPVPDGAYFPCMSNADCVGNEYCAGTGCGTPGGCLGLQSRGDCSGEVSEVCGCNGLTYTNECWARAAGTRVRSTAPCE
jgi:hypothetical protein